MAFIEANSRLPRQVGGDVQAQSAANASMERRLQELLTETGLVRLRRLGDLLQERSEQAMRRRLQALPDGRYVGEAFSDGIGEELRLQVAVSVCGDEVRVDYTGTAPQSRFGLNVPLNLTVAESIYALRVASGAGHPPPRRIVPAVRGDGPRRLSAQSVATGPDDGAHDRGPQRLRRHLACPRPARPRARAAPPAVRPLRRIWTFRFRGVLRETPECLPARRPEARGRPYTETYFSNGGMGALGDSDGARGHVDAGQLLERAGRSDGGAGAGGVRGKAVAP